MGQAITQWAQDNRPPAADDTLYYDLDVTEADLPAVLSVLKAHAPYGPGAEKPVLALRGLRLQTRGGQCYRLMGKGHEHLKLFGQVSDAVGFDLTAAYLDLGCPGTVDLLGVVEETSSWGKPPPVSVPCHSSLRGSHPAAAARGAAAGPSMKTTAKTETPCRASYGVPHGVFFVGCSAIKRSFCAWVSCLIAHSLRMASSWWQTALGRPAPPGGGSGYTSRRFPRCGPADGWSSHWSSRCTRSRPGISQYMYNFLPQAPLPPLKKCCKLSYKRIKSGRNPFWPQCLDFFPLPVYPIPTRRQGKLLFPAGLGRTARGAPL